MAVEMSSVLVWWVPSASEASMRASCAAEQRNVTDLRFMVLQSYRLVFCLQAVLYVLLLISCVMCATANLSGKPFASALQCRRYDKHAQHYQIHLRVHLFPRMACYSVPQPSALYPLLLGQAIRRRASLVGGGSLHPQSHIGGAA